MLLTTKGVVIHSVKYGDNSLISKIISQEKGLISVISSRKNAKKNKKGNYFQPLSAVQIVCYSSNKSTLSRVKEITFNKSVPVSDNIAVSSVRFFLAEILHKVIKEEEQNFQLYSFLETELKSLYSVGANVATFPIKFLIDLMDLLGIQPDIDTEHMYFDFHEGHSVITKPMHSDFSDKNETMLFHQFINQQNTLNKLQRKQLLNLLLNYYNVQLSAGLENLKSKAVLEVVLA